MANPIFSGVSTYIDENRELIYGKIMLNIPFVDRFGAEPTDAKGGKIAINKLSTEPVFGDGTVCGVQAGTATISQRKIELASLQTATPYCAKALYPYFAGLKIRLGANVDESGLAEAFTNAEVTKINEGLEKMIWQGTKSTTSCDGLLTIAKADGANQVSTGSSLYETVNAVRLAAAGAGLKKFIVAVPADKYYALLDEMVAKNLYHMPVPTAQTTDVRTFVFPNSDIEVWGVEGLNTSNSVLAFEPDNARYGYNEKEGIGDIKWAVDEVNDIAYLKTSEVLGVNFAFINEVFYATLS